MSDRHHSIPGANDSIDERLRLVFRSLDTSPQFEGQVLARIRAEAHSLAARSALAAAREEQLYRESLSALRRWRRAALRMLTFDALAAGAVCMVIIAVGMRSQEAFPGWMQAAASLIPATDMQSLGVLLSAMLGFAPLLLLKFARWRHRVHT